MPRILGRISAALMVSAVVCFVAAARPKAADDPVFSQINSIVKSLSEITGLSQEHAVPYGRMSKRQLRQFLAKRIKKTLKPDEIHADELALKMFGLVPEDFDLKKSTVDLLTEQAAAFYDYDAKRLFLLDESSFTEETTTLAHELSHALADQHFNLSKFMDEAPSNDDENLAHTAVVEGQASWLMIAYDLKQAGQQPVPTPDMLKTVVDSSESSMADFPVLKGSPLYIQQSLLFPYTEGTLFFNAVYKKMGQRAFAAVFTDPPLDSAQVIHPDRYFAHLLPAHPHLPRVQLGSKTKEVTEGSVGEFDHAMLIRQYLGEAVADELSPHLSGGEFKIVSEGKSRNAVLTYASQWDSEEKAGDFFDAYVSILQHKWKRCDISTSEDEWVAGQGDDGYFVVYLSGNTVNSVEGLSDVQDWQRLKNEIQGRQSEVSASAKRTIAKGAGRVQAGPGLRLH